jgi:hypothetical protein
MSEGTESRYGARWNRENREGLDNQIESEIMAFLNRLFPEPHLLPRGSNRNIYIEANLSFRMDRFDGQGTTIRDAIDDLIGRLGKYIALNVDIFAEEEYSLLMGMAPDLVSYNGTSYIVCARLCLIWHHPFRKADNYELATDWGSQSRPWRDV